MEWHKNDENPSGQCRDTASTVNCEINNVSAAKQDFYFAAIAAVRD